MESRRLFAVPPMEGTFEGIRLDWLDPGDRDDRSFLIRAEHPELARALRDDAEEVEVDGARFNPRLHLTLHETVAAQLWDDDPPEVWHAACRLLDAGYERHEVFHMLGSAAASEIWNALHEGKPYDRERYVRALNALPGSWEAQRPR